MIGGQRQTTFQAPPEGLNAEAADRGVKVGSLVDVYSRTRNPLLAYTHLLI